MTVFILGPGRDESGGDAPLRARRELARRMTVAGTSAIVMEDEPDSEGENSFAKFRRLVRERNVTTFLVVVPLRSRLHGVSVEIGHLLTELQEGRLPADRVHLVLQTLLASVEDDASSRSRSRATGRDTTRT